MSAAFLVAAPQSGSGKTTVTLAILRALARRGTVRAAKSGPDYIDPAFHAAACGAPSVNLDAWAMGAEQIRALAPRDGVLVVEGAMGLFDGAPPDGTGSAAHLARLLDIPVVLVVDASKMAQSVAPLIAGFTGFDPRLRFAGVILNNVGSARHEAMLRRAVTAAEGPPVLGAVPRQGHLETPSRHLGLVQAMERPDLENWLDTLGDLAEKFIDLDHLVALPDHAIPQAEWRAPPPPAQRISVARDEAFAFCYPHLLAQWRAQGAEILPFSPLADEAVPDCDLVYLPGGYPELHGGRISGNQTFLDSLRIAAQTTDIYGECGGYMVLGETLTDAAGKVHPMAGLLRLQTSFANRKLHLGYRVLQAHAGPFAGAWRGHEFHYATTMRAEGAPLFAATDAEGTALAPMGLRSGRVYGSFAHIIAPTPRF